MIDFLIERGNLDPDTDTHKGKMMQRNTRRRSKSRREAWNRQSRREDGILQARTLEWVAISFSKA